MNNSLLQKPRIVLAALCITVAATANNLRAEVTADRTERGVAIKIDGKPFTEYLIKAGQSPALWPLLGPNGKAITRAWPLGPREKDGTNDHPHHQSLWVTHDQVSGANFWGGNRNDADGKNGPRIVHREFVDVSNSGETARIVTRNDWMNGNKRICEDERTLVFGKRDSGERWIDYAILIKATDGPVTFGDTKEGTFALRVADSMRVEAKKGGRIINSEGRENEAAWGLPARWVDYSGPVDGATVGVAILSHPNSFRPTPRWHVRTYGLFAANPFGQHDFPKPEAAQQGPVTLEKGDCLSLRYLLLLHDGPADEAAIESAFTDFTRDADETKKNAEGCKTCL